MAAKKIQISTDGGSTWLDLPGSQGGFNSEAEEVDDTILGQTFKSNDVGLIGWSVSSDGIYKGFSGYLAEIKQVGTATGFTAEAMALVSGKTYQITDGTKAIWDRSEATMDILDNAISVSAANIESIDYLFGRVTFVSSYTPTTPITATGKYFPVSAAGCSNSYNLTMNADAIDQTCFSLAQANGGYRVFTAGLRTVSLELTGIFDATENFKSILLARQEIIIEIDPAGDGGSIARGFFKLTSTGQSGAVGALEEETLNFSLTVPDETTNPEADPPFSWSHSGSTRLSPAIQAALTSWLSELNTYQVRYLPTGVTGASPLDGIKGAFVVTDISLSGGLSAMNTFQMELQGTGAYTEV
jgi:predicted secreted protein